MHDAAFARLLAACRATTNPGAYVAAWKKTHPEGKVVGFFPTYVPTELVLAAGALPVGIWGGSIPGSRANAYIQQFTCSIVRSATEYALKGTFDVLDTVLFPPICDSVKMVSSSWKLNLSDRFHVDMVNLPERLDSDSSVAYLAAELRRTADMLSQRVSQPVGDEAVRRAIGACNRVRAAQEKFYAWRKTPAGAQAAFPDVCTIVKAATVMDPEEYVGLLEGFLAAAEAPPQRRSRAVPVVATGLACQLPHADFLGVFESAGLRVVNDDLLFGMRACGQIAVDGDPYMNIARALADSKPLATRFHSRRLRHELVLEQVRTGKAKAAVFLVPKFCEPEWFDLRYLKKELADRDIPNITIDFEEDPGMLGAVQTRLEAFAESLA